MVERPDGHREGQEFMKGFVYILQTKDDHYYVGSTNDIKRRLLEHRSGKATYLRNLLPIRLLFNQEYDDIKLARKIEYKLKKFKNRKIIENIIKDKKIIINPK